MKTRPVYIIERKAAERKAEWIPLFHEVFNSLTSAQKQLPNYAWDGFRQFRAAKYVPAKKGKS
jgi:hypothetical protein